MLNALQAWRKIKVNCAIRQRKNEPYHANFIDYCSVVSLNARYSRLRPANICLKRIFSSFRSFIIYIAQASIPPYIASLLQSDDKEIPTSRQSSLKVRSVRQISERQGYGVWLIGLYVWKSHKGTKFVFCKFTKSEWFVLRVSSHRLQLGNTTRREIIPKQINAQESAWEYLLLKKAVLLPMLWGQTEKNLRTDCYIYNYLMSACKVQPQEGCTGRLRKLVIQCQESRQSVSIGIISFLLESDFNIIIKG